jgi:hypothetical protein
MANRITLNRADADNAGRFVDAGETLAIGDATGDDGKGVITPDRAQALLDAEGAVATDEPAPSPAPAPAAPDADA